VRCNGKSPAWLVKLAAAG
jgi:hypothetical protein